MAIKVIVLCALVICCANSMFIRGRTDFGRLSSFPPWDSLSPDSNVQELIPSTTTEFEGKEYDGYSARKSSQTEDKKFIVVNEKLPWSEARDACENRGMKLASLENAEQKQRLENYIRNNDLLPIDVFSGYWVGGKRVTDSTMFTWESNGNPVVVRGWLPGEPNYFTGEDCLELKNDEGNLGWNNYYCHEAKRFICEEIATQESLKNEKVSRKDFHVEEEKMLLNEIMRSMKLVSANEQEDTTPKAQNGSNSTENESLVESEAQNFFEEYYGDIDY